MKHAFRAAILLLVLATAGASAAPVCTPIPPTEWSGHVDALHVAGSGAVAHFEGNGCDWGGLEQLNGTDGLVLDVAGHPGAADVVVDLGQGSLTHNLTAGRFLGVDCKTIEGSDFEAGTGNEISPTVTSVVIPESARWFILDSTTEFGVTDVTVTVRSHGTDCPRVKKPRKKR